VWLFSSGPVGDRPEPREAPADVPELVELTGAVRHQLFRGRVDADRVGPVERGVVRLLDVPTGDFRDGEAIDAVAAEIAGTLSALLPAVRAPAG